mgnify:CR=1 FL=1|tara:strand:+ start:22864 stop:23064 length:201 start_codon:yes stop_codon:yes gene_type:complete
MENNHNKEKIITVLVILNAVFWIWNLGFVTGGFFALAVPGSLWLAWELLAWTIAIPQNLKLWWEAQ